MCTIYTIKVRVYESSHKRRLEFQGNRGNSIYKQLWAFSAMLEPDLTAHNRCLGTPTRPVPRKSACSRYKLGLKLIHDPEARPLTSSSLVKLERLAAHLRANVRASLLLGLSSPLPNPWSRPKPSPAVLPPPPVALPVKPVLMIAADAPRQRTPIYPPHISIGTCQHR